MKEPNRKPRCIAGEAIPENADPFNQKAKAALKELGIEADPTQLYSLHLMHWMLWTHGDVYRHKDLETFREFLPDWEGSPSDKVMKLLTRVWQSEDEVYNSPPEDASPLELADYLITNTHWTLTDMDIGHPIP